MNFWIIQIRRASGTPTFVSVTKIYWGTFYHDSHTCQYPGWWPSLTIAKYQKCSKLHWNWYSYYFLDENYDGVIHFWQKWSFVPQKRFMRYPYSRGMITCWPPVIAIGPIWVPIIFYHQGQSLVFSVCFCFHESTEYISLFHWPCCWWPPCQISMWSMPESGRRTKPFSVIHVITGIISDVME